MAGRPGMYRGDRRRKEDQRKAKQEAKRARRAERKETGASGPETEAMPVADTGAPVDFVWFSPTNGRTLTTRSSFAARRRGDRRLDPRERAAPSGRS